MKITGFGIANYRSFGPEGEFVRDFGKINVFIGKNNSGKSNVLRFLTVASKLRSQEWPSTDRHKMSAEKPQCIFSITLDNELDGLSWSLNSKEQLQEVSFDLWFGNLFPNTVCKNALDIDILTNEKLEELRSIVTHKRYMGIEAPSRHQLLHDLSEVLTAMAQNEYLKVNPGLIYIPAIREIRTTTDSKAPIEKQDESLSGKDLIRKLRVMQHPGIGKDEEQKKFNDIQEMIQQLLDIPDLEVAIPAEEDDIHFRMHDGVRLPLANFGTGIHELVIICTALALYENRWVCIEEPEIHLHPELLRRFLRFLRTTNNTYFIATHSNVLLDADEVDAVYHVRHDGQASHIERCTTNSQSRKILRDLGYRASDLLQTNGIIWVEGPSDRNYIKRWLELAGTEAVEGIDYSIMFYGGACLANVSFAENISADSFIDLLRINPNVVVVIDRDGNNANDPLREYKERVKSEIPEKCWITKGREIENYLPGELLQRFLEKRFPDKVRPFKFDPNHKIDNVIKRALIDCSFVYSRKKREYSEQICKEMTASDLDRLDLRVWIEQIQSSIKSWKGETA